MLLYFSPCFSTHWQLKVKYLRIQVTSMAKRNPFLASLGDTADCQGCNTPTQLLCESLVLSSLNCTGKSHPLVLCLAPTAAILICFVLQISSLTVTLLECPKCLFFYKTTSGYSDNLVTVTIFPFPGKDCNI